MASSEKIYLASERKITFKAIFCLKRFLGHHDSHKYYLITIGVEIPFFFFLADYPLARNQYINQKNPRVRKIRVRNSGAGNGCANFMDTWKKSVLSAGKPVSVKFLLFRGGFLGGGGGSADFNFYGRADFSDIT